MRSDWSIEDRRQPRSPPPVPPWRCDFCAIYTDRWRLDFADYTSPPEHTPCELCDFACVLAALESVPPYPSFNVLGVVYPDDCVCVLEKQF